MFITMVMTKAMPPKKSDTIGACRSGESAENISMSPDKCIERAISDEQHDGAGDQPAR